MDPNPLLSILEEGIQNSSFIRQLKKGMIMNNLINIIVPVYKVEKYSNQCDNSIIKQTYTNLENILVDDGSPD